jgi:hypothetical protein
VEKRNSSYPLSTELTRRDHFERWHSEA